MLISIFAEEGARSKSRVPSVSTQTEYWILDTALLLFDFLQPRRLSLKSAQVVKLGAPDFG